MKARRSFKDRENGSEILYFIYADFFFLILSGNDNAISSTNKNKDFKIWTLLLPSNSTKVVRQKVAVLHADKPTDGFTYISDKRGFDHKQ